MQKLFGRRIVITGRHLIAQFALIMVTVNGYAGVIETITLQPGLADGKDNSMSRGGEGTEGRANENSGGSDALTIGMIGNHGQVHRVLMQFDLPTLNPGDTLLSARLGLTVFETAVSSAPIEIYRLNHIWVEGTQTGPDANPPDGATWQTFDGSNAWPGISGFRSLDGSGFSLLSAEINDPLGSGTLFNNGEISWFDLDVAKVSEWMTGAFTNNGFLVRSLNENSGSSSIAFASSEYFDPGLHPIFEFTIDSVPEPSTIVMFLIGAVGLFGYRWRRHRAGCPG
ncbi:MAG: DNRLRE domain-containing protein [Planctomycetaceae bacterium]